MLTRPKTRVRNNSDIDNLAARIADCLQKNDYEITDQNNFPNEGRDQRLTKILILFTEKDYY